MIQLPSYADCGNASPPGQYRTSCTETADQAAQSEPRSRALGLLIILTSAAAFYGAIAVFIWKHL